MANETTNPISRQLTPIEVTRKDAATACLSSLKGAAEALFYRAEAEDDAMLHLISETIENQVEELEQLVS